MRKMVVALSALTVAGASLAGCNHQAAEHAAASKDLHSALAIMNQANRGYASDQGQNRQDLQVYRQQTLEKAVTPLQDVMKQGSSAQQVAAATLLAQIELSRARFLAGSADDQYGQLQARSGVIVGDAVGVDAAAGRIRLLNVDNSAGVTQLQAALKQLTEQQAALQEKVQAQQTAAAAQKTQAGALQAKANKLMAQAQQIHTQGFVSHGDKKYDLYDQAAGIQSKAAAASFEAERHQVDQRVEANKLAYLKAKAQLTAAAIDMIQKRISGLQDQQQQVTASRQEARQQQQQAAKQVGKEFTQLQSAYQGAVTSPYKEAEQHVENALKLLTTARLQASGNSSNVELDLLSSRVDQAQILTAHARAAKGYADLLALVAVGAQKRTPELAGPLTDALKEARSAQAALAKQAAEAVSAGQKIAGELANRSGDAASIAKAQQALLSKYQTVAQQLGQG